MATYYRWRKSEIGYTEGSVDREEGDNRQVETTSNNIRYMRTKPPVVIRNGRPYYDFNDSAQTSGSNTPESDPYDCSNLYWYGHYAGGQVFYKTMMLFGGGAYHAADDPNPKNVWAKAPYTYYHLDVGAGELVGYVYSLDSSAYPDHDVQDEYYYQSYGPVQSPTAPYSINYTLSATSNSITVSWGSADSETNYPVNWYELESQIDGGEWSPSYNGYSDKRSYTVNFGGYFTSYRFRVRARDTNYQWGEWKTGSIGTRIHSPGAPTVSAPSTAISGESITVTWGAVSGATSYTVQRNTGGSWTQVYSGNDLTFNETVGVWDSLQYRVQAVNQAGSGSWGYSGAITVYTSPTLTVPSLAMQGQSIAVSWTSIEGADSYTVQRKSSADTDWTQVYSGTALTYSETAGTWTTVQYRVQAVFDGTPGGWATSAEIPVVSASALVISGQDGDLGTLVNDVPYSISTDTGNQITATITVNGAVIFSGNVGNSTAGVIPVMDLITGEGTITIEASVTASSGPVSAVRTWTYTKNLITFPNAAGVAQLTQDGKNVFPKTLAECVRLPGGGTLDQVMGFPCQIYTGTEYGINNNDELVFPFTPKALLVFSGVTLALFIRGSNTGYCSVSSNSYEDSTLEWKENSIRFVDSPFVANQTYTYVCFG